MKSTIIPKRLNKTHVGICTSDIYITLNVSSPWPF